MPELADEIASGKVKAGTPTGRPLTRVQGKPKIAQLLSLFDFTRGAVVLAPPRKE